MLSYELKMIKSIKQRLKLIKLLIFIRYIYEIGKAVSINRHDSRESCFKLHNCESLTASLALCPKSCLKYFELRSSMLLAFKMARRLLALGFEVSCPKKGLQKNMLKAKEKMVSLREKRKKETRG